MSIQLVTILVDSFAVDQLKRGVPISQLILSSYEVGDGAKGRVLTFINHMLYTVVADREQRNNTKIGKLRAEQ